MSDLALRIRTAREKMGVSIEDAERATKIRRRYIEAIESGDFARLPDGPPSRGFIKNYARYLDLDSDQALNDFEAEVGVPITQVSEVVPPPPTRQPAVSRYTQLIKLPQIRWKGELPSDDQAELDQLAESDSQAPVTTTETRGSLGNLVFRRSLPPAVANSFSLREPKVTHTSDVRPFQSGRSAFSLGGASGSSNIVEPRRLSPMSAQGVGPLRNPLVFMMAGALLLVVAFVGLVVLPALQGNGLRVVAPAATQAISVSILGTPQTPAVINEMAGTTANPATPQPIPTEQGPQATIQPRVGGGVQLILDARERAWVRVKVDGNIAYEGIPLIGPTAPWRGQNTVGIETGNAGAFEVIINDVRFGPAGAHNATVRVTWDTTGQVVQNP